MNEIERKALFASSPMVESFLAVLLQDAQLHENDEACTEEREAYNSGTIYACSDETLAIVVKECERFTAAIAAHLAAVPDGALVGLDLTCRYTLEHIGSDLYLERAGHGAGFRDRRIWSDDSDENNAIGETLSGLVTPGGVDFHFDDDGTLFVVAYVTKERES
jgi:hypothetical protein